MLSANQEYSQYCLFFFFVCGKNIRHNDFRNAKDIRNIQLCREPKSKYNFKKIFTSNLKYEYAHFLI